jgi:enamine deaminase RidA (YjgF/YER057c/UK114 family)
MAGRLRYSNPDGVHPPLGPYSHAVAVPPGAEMLYISGQVGVAADGSCGPTIAEQADQAFANLIAVLVAHGLDVGSVVKLTVFIVAGHDGDAVRRARVKHFGSVEPASSTMYVSQLVKPEWLIEVEAVAAGAAPEGR